MSVIARLGRGDQDVAECGEASVEDLLLPAHPIEFDDFDRERIVEVSGRIVKGKMPIRANPEEHYINCLLAQQRCIGAACLLRVGIGLDEMRPRERNMIEELALKPLAEALRSLRRQIDVLIHVKCSDSVPFDARFANESGKHLALAWRGSQDDAQVRLLSQATAQRGTDILRGLLS